ncbi:hypothetical protein N2152v2_008739 [Parachlorella kessleri]
MAGEELVQWCLASGVSFHGIESGFVAEGWRGVLAAQHLEPDTCILRVPERLLLTVQSAWRDPQLRAVLEGPGCKLSSFQVLAVHLLHEVSKGPSSFWWPYLRSLPRAYTAGMCFRPADIEALQVPYAQAAVEQAVERALEQWRGALPSLRVLHLPSKWLSKQAWLWAASTLSSRTMFVPFDPAGALTPFGDLHNYAPPPPPYTPSLRPSAPASSSQAQSRQQQQQQQGQQLCQQGGSRPLQHSGGQASYSQPLPAHGVPQAPLRCRPAELGLGGAALAPAGVVEPGSGSQLADDGIITPHQHMLRAAAAAEGSGGGAAGRGGCEAPSCPGGASSLSDGCRCSDSRVGPGRGAAPGASGSCLQADDTPQPWVPLEAPACAPGSCQPQQEQQGETQQQGEVAPSALRQEQDLQERQQGVRQQQQQSPEQEQEEGLCGDGCLDKASGEYCLYARRRYEAGEQVFLCYGRHTNLELLEHYGFILPTNPHDTAALQITALPPEVAAKLASAGLEGPGCYIHHNGSPSWDLLRALRLAAATPDERRSSAYLALDGRPISRAGEGRALAMLRSACCAALRGLPSTAQQDEQLLASQGGGLPPTDCSRVAVEWRLGYKR